MKKAMVTLRLVPDAGAGQTYYRVVRISGDSPVVIDTVSSRVVRVGDYITETAAEALGSTVAKLTVTR